MGTCSPWRQLLVCSVHTPHRAVHFFQNMPYSVLRCTARHRSVVALHDAAALDEWEMKRKESQPDTPAAAPVR